MSVISMKQLLEAGVHFGHPTKRWNPKMAKYIYQERNDIHIINLESTAAQVELAYAFVKEAVASGKTVLFVGSKKQAQDSIKEEAERCGMYYINTRWLGGTLTNFKTIKSSIERLNRLNKMEANGEFEVLTKKEVAKLVAERNKLELSLGGIKEMKTLPGVIFVVDGEKEHICLHEAKLLGIPTVGLIDTNCNPEDVTICIPGNDDAIRAVKLIAGAIADAVIEGKGGEVVRVVDEDENTQAATQDEVEAEIKEEALEKAEEVKEEIEE